MSFELGMYSFLPWLRHGIAGAITAADLDVNVKERASVQVDLTLSGDGGALTQPVGRPVSLYGPGDLVGIDPRAIVRVEPRNYVTAFEPNYLAHVEFYDEDFPWRYTPAAPDGAGRLRPWIALVVLTDEEFEESAQPGRPLPAISIPDASKLPAAADLWAWAHVHVNRSLAATAAEMTSPDMNAVLPRLASVLAENPDLACSRIVCPRRLDENTGYHAFVVPVFESGRLAGLGHDPSAAPHATFSAWAGYQDKEDEALLPVYHRWYFATGARQDFESLVRLLEPKGADPRVGRRDMDVQLPGAALPGILDVGLGGVLRLGGALRVPYAALTPAQLADAQHYDHWADPQPHPFQVAIAATINLADDYVDESVPPEPDPVLTMPMYGRWHALQKRLLSERDGTPVSPDDNWVHDLNLDPRHRVAAGFGTRVVQQNQEEYMDAAWNQLGAVLEANEKIRQAQLAKEAAAALHRRHLVPLAGLDPDRALTLTAPVHSRVVLEGTTVRYRRATSMVPPVLTSTAMRRMTRPRGPIARLLGETKGGLLARVDAGEITAAPPKRTPPGVVTIDEVARAFEKARQSRDPGELLTERAHTPKTIDRLPEPDGFFIAPPSARKQEPRHPTKGEAGRFKEALSDWYRLLAGSRESAREPKLEPLGVADASAGLIGALDPQVTVPRRVLSGITLPPWLIELLGEQFQEVMAYPQIDLPMYKPLVGLSKDCFLPNLNLVEQNSITLLETNQEFIEAYMVGLNHEFARELLWREYPTDQRGSSFRQFWDVRGVLDSEGLSADDLREKLYDIPKLHLWSRFSDLGDHDNRELPGETEQELVLLIRGELLKKYPTAVIYAHRAAWDHTSGAIDTNKERLLATLTDAEAASPPPGKVKTPLYEAKVDPDVYFFGFDLTAEEAKGGPGASEDDAGWFFVIKERPGDPRFGLDIEREAGEHLQTFNDLAWQDVAGVDPGEHLPATAFSAVSLGTPGAGEHEKDAQHTEDAAVNPLAQSSARLAYILYQAPVMVAVHAAEMLRPRP
jgi:hypothetical protein